MRLCGSSALAVVVLALTAVPAAGEEFVLKDGTRIVGKIVAYQEDSFRVETSFGFAVIYKDRVERIVFTEGGKQAPAGTAPTAPPATASAAKSEASAASRPLAPPRRPDTIIEHVSGTEYVNETYRFQLFKPPTWRSYPELVKPQAPLVAALGTPDETTLLLVGSEFYQGSLPEYARMAESTLRQLYAEYQPLEESRTEVARLPALTRRFTGQAEGRYWTGMAIYFAREHHVYTVLGLTAASETTSLQLAVLERVVGSFKFFP